MGHQEHISKNFYRRPSISYPRFDGLLRTYERIVPRQTSSKFSYRLGAAVDVPGDPSHERQCVPWTALTAPPLASG
jgi:hypothetical protein